MSVFSQNSEVVFKKFLDPGSDYPQILKSLKCFFVYDFFLMQKGQKTPKKNGQSSPTEDKIQWKW